MIPHKTTSATALLGSDFSSFTPARSVCHLSSLAFTYKGKAVKVQEVGRELGVRYVVEGSVRQSATQVRISAQLVNVSTGLQLWSGRYDRELKDIFTLQDEIVRKIGTTLNLQLTLQKQGVLVSPSTDNMDAYDHFLRGVSFCFFNPSRETNLHARQQFEQAVALDLQYAEAYAYLGMTYVRGVLFYLEGQVRVRERRLGFGAESGGPG